MRTRSKKQTRTSPGAARMRKTMRRAIELIRARQKQSTILQDYIAQMERSKKRRR